MPSDRTPSSNLKRGYSIALVSAAILSTTAIFIRYLTQTYHVPALVLAFWRDVFVFLTLLIALALLRPALLRVRRPNLVYLAIYGLMLAIFNALWTLSVALNGAAISTVLVYCSAGFTALLGRWLLKERLGWAKLLAIAVSFSGCVLVSEVLNQAPQNVNLAGLVTGVLAGLWYAIYSLMGRSAAQRGLNPWTTLFYTFSVAAIFLLAFNLIPGGPIPGSALKPADLMWLGSALPAWGVLLLLAAGPTVAGFGLYNVSLSYLPSSVANLIATLEPAFTTVTAFVLLGERMSAVQAFGSLMILAGVVFLRIYEGRQEQKNLSESEAAAGPSIASQ